MCEFHGEHKEVFLRNADINDIDIIYDWANDAEVRKNSFSSKKFHGMYIINGIKN